MLNIIKKSGIILWFQTFSVLLQQKVGNIAKISKV